MSRSTLNPDPGETLRRFRDSYTNYYTLWKETGSTPEGVRLRTPAEEPIDEGDMPAALREELARFREAHPGVRLGFLKHMRTVNGAPDVVVEDGRDLPEPDRLLTLSHTVVLSAEDELHVVTDVYVAEKE